MGYVAERAIQAMRESLANERKKEAIASMMDVWGSPGKALVSTSSGIINSVAGLTGTLLHGANKLGHYTGEMGDRQYQANKQWLQDNLNANAMARLAESLGGPRSGEYVRTSERQFPVLNSVAEAGTDVAGVLKAGTGLLNWGSPTKVMNKGVASTIVMKDPFTGKEVLRQIYGNGRRSTRESTRLNNSTTQKAAAGVLGTGYVAGGEALEDKASQ